MNRKHPLVSITGVLLLLAACSGSGGTPEALAPGRETPAIQVSPTFSLADSLNAPGVLHQWAVSAEASTEFSDPEWGAQQALGMPDSPGCGDYQFAWASAPSDSIDTLVLEYPTLVYPLEIRIIESFNPDQVVKVEVYDPESGGYYTVLQKNPIQVDRPCPFELVVPVENINFLSNTIRITVDQSQLGLGWNEIDAVQLIGREPEP